MAHNPRLIGTGARGVRPWPFAFAGRNAMLLPALAFVAVAAPLSAQVRVGGHGLYRNDIVTSGFGVGARAEFDLGFIMPELGLGGVYNRFFVDDCAHCRSWEAGGQVTLGEGSSYIGLNTVLSRFEEDQENEINKTDDWKFSVVIGFRLLNVPVAVPFLEVRQSLGSGLFNDQALSLGILIGPARARQAPRPGAPR